MKKINILDKHFAQLIAAGEVVEKPASVVKELVENSIDSGASRICVEIKHGGISLIKVSDNGSGIYRDDVKNAFLRHATSKIKDENDLNNIGSLGFRGEALASICAVSKVELITKTKEENSGTKFSIVAGVPGKIEDIGSSVGTIISARDLFFNVPARMKFLRKDIAEANMCAAVVDKLALSHPEISFKFIRDGKETMHPAGDGNIASAIYGVYGKEFFDGMIPLKYTYEKVSVSGYISRPTFSKSSRNAQNFFINGRYIKSKLISTALEEAFKNSIMVGKFPCCVMYLNVPLGSVDVNTHPTKTEVKFVNEKTIFDAVYYAVKTALMNDSNRTILKPENDFFGSSVLSDVSNTSSVAPATANTQPVQDKKDIFEAKSEFKNSVLSASNNTYADGFETAKEETDGFDIMKTKSVGVDIPESSNTQNSKITADETPKAAENTDFSFNNIGTKVVSPKAEVSQMKLLPKESEFKVIGEIFDCFIIIEQNGEMILVDKHAAHERILFEKMKNSVQNFDSQRLLSPVVVNLEKDEYSAIIENLNLLEKVGYKVEDFGDGSVVVRDVPMYIECAEVSDSITEISNYLMAHKKSLDTKKLEWLYDNISCRAAVKAGSKSSSEEIVFLVKQLVKNPNVQNCPHGRPIFVSFSKRFIEKEFGRT